MVTHMVVTAALVQQWGTAALRRHALAERAAFGLTETFSPRP